MRRPTSVRQPLAALAAVGVALVTAARAAAAQAPDTAAPPAAAAVADSAPAGVAPARKRSRLAGFGRAAVGRAGRAVAKAEQVTGVSREQAAQLALTAATGGASAALLSSGPGGRAAPGCPAPAGGVGGAIAQVVPGGHGLSAGLGLLRRRDRAQAAPADAPPSAGPGVFDAAAGQADYQRLLARASAGDSAATAGVVRLHVQLAAAAGRVAAVEAGQRGAAREAAVRAALECATVRRGCLAGAP